MLLRGPKVRNLASMFSAFLFALGIRLWVKDPFHQFIITISLIVAGMFLSILLTFYAGIRRRVVRGLNYLWRITTHPWHLTDEIGRLKEIYQREDDPIKLTLFGGWEIMDNPGRMAVILRVDDYSSATRHLQEVAFHAVGGKYGDFPIVWEFDGDPELTKKNGNLHLAIPGNGQRSFNIILPTAPLFGCRIESVQCRAILGDDMEKKSNILKIPQHTGMKWKTDS